MWFLNLNEGVCYEEMNKPVEKPLVVDVNTLDLHKGEKSLKKTSFNWISFLVGWIVGACCCILLDVLSVVLQRL